MNDRRLFRWGAPKSGGRPKPRSAPRPAGRSLGWLPALFAAFVATVGVVVSACSGDSTFKAPTSGPSGSGSGSTSSGTTLDDAGGCVGPTCPDACADHPVPGCSCNVEGQHLDCGKAEATFPGVGTSPGTVVCGQGFSVCADGVWGACQITGDVQLVPNAPPGYYAENYGTGSPCVANPCDPQCLDFVDTPGGVDAGRGLVATDAGVALSGDAGVCIPKTCASQGFSCGQQSDGCGNVIQCGTCTFPATCGGAGTPNVCGVSVSCTNLCLNQAKCSGTNTTSISGTVYMPNGTTPLPNVLVYVPNSLPTVFLPTLSCVTAGNCTAEVTGSPLVATTSNIDGTFTLTNVPAGVPFPVVIQLGRFRRQFTMSAVPACTNAVVPCTSATACLSRFPRVENETSIFDNIPKMAFITGNADSLECVWRKVGISSTGAPGLGGTSYGTGEFTPGPTSGRINLYAANTSTYGAYIGSPGGTTPWDTTLLSNPLQMSAYDIILFPCQGAETYYGALHSTYETNIANFLNAGGRVFATHYSYVWLYSGTNGTKTYASPLSPAINWTINASYTGWSDPAMGQINTATSTGQVLAAWLQVPAVNASPAYGEMQINTLRRDFSGVPAPGEVYVSVNQCETLSSDQNNCGACGNICGSGKVCSNGACVSSCGTGLVKCGSSCVNEQTDFNNCGGCTSGNNSYQCSPGQTCVSGNCVCTAGTCPDSNGTCRATTTNTDPLNCGACGNECGYGQTCVAGACKCGTGLSQCTDSGYNVCVNTTNDPYNCGGCNVVCGAGTMCVSGVCTCEQSGETTCSNTNACALTASDATACGSTCTACSGTKKYCSAGMCTSTKPTCTSPSVFCTNTCTNRSTDPKNCGTCGNVCGAGTTCVSGSCQNIACGTGLTHCFDGIAGGCVNLQTDTTNCGACENGCPDGASCVAGSCTCGAGQTSCTVNNQPACVNMQTDATNCGSCGNTCAAGSSCVAGSCVACGGANLQTDPYNCGACGLACVAGQTCVSGTCTCGSGATNCSFPMQASFNTPPTFAPYNTPAANQCGRAVFSDFHVENASTTQYPFPQECNNGAFSPQEFLLAQALFDLAGCVNIGNTTPTCTPVTCGFLGLNCGPAGDGCGGTLNCGSCTAPATCGGSGVFGVCGVPLTFTSTPFVRDYNASNLCTNGQAPVWRLYSWSSVTAKNSSIAFSIATSTTQAGLATATPYPLQWSSPPGVPTGLMAGAAASAHAAGNPTGSPDTELGSASPDSTLYANKQPQNNPFLRVIATLNPSSDLVTSPVLSSWDMQIDCVDIN